MRCDIQIISNILLRKIFHDIDKYGLNNISDLKQNPDLFTGILTETDIIQTDSVIDKDSIIGAKIYPYSDEVIILQGDGQFYYFEKIVTD